MGHPKDRSGLTRGELLRGAAAAAAGVGVAGGLAACENTTTPIGACEDASAAGGSPLVVAKPVGPGGLPLPRTDNSVTWAITDDNPRIKDGLQPETGSTLHLFNYPDYIWPGLLRRFENRYDCTVDVGDLQLGGRGDRQAPVRRRRLRRHHRPLGLQHRQPDGAAAPPAAQPHLPAEPREEHLAASSPTRSTTAARTTRSRTSPGGRDRLAERQDLGGHPGHGRALGHLLALRGVVRQGRPPRRQAGRTLDADAARRAAPRSRIADLNTEDEAVVAKAGKDLEQLTEICNIKVTITDYQTLPEGTNVPPSLLVRRPARRRAFYYMPPGVSPDVLSYWWPEANGVVQNDFLCVDAESPRAPSSRTSSSTTSWTRRSPTTTSSTSTATCRRRKGIDADALVGEGVIPETLATAVVRPDQFLANQELLQLTVEGERCWDQAWSQFRAGLEGRWSLGGHGGSWRLPESPGSRSSSSSPSTR